MNYKKYLSGVLAAAMVLNTGAVSVLAAGTDTSVQERYTSIHMMERSVPFLLTITGDFIWEN